MKSKKGFTSAGADTIRRYSSGFTLIEVVVAFVVLIIISASLMQAFVVSAKLNRRAYDTDKATALATRIQEVFRRDTSRFRMKPTDTDYTTKKTNLINYLNANIEELTNIEPTFEPNKMTIIRYLQSDWETATSETGAAYTVKAEITYNGEADTEDSYYPDANLVWFLNLDAYKAATAPAYIELTANESNAQLTYAVNSQLGTRVYENPSSAELVLVIDNQGKQIDTNVNIVIYNYSSKKVKLYVLDAPKLGSSYNVTIVGDMSEGLYEYSIVPSSDFSFLTDSMEVTITRISDGTVLAKSSVTGYYKYEE